MHQKDMVEMWMEMNDSLKEKQLENRNIFLDMLRIIACVGVIGIHILMDYRIRMDGTANNAVILAESLIRWPVPCFLMLSGHFLFQKEFSLKKLMIKIVKRLAIPLALTALFITIFGAWVLNISSLVQCVSNLTWDNLIDYGKMLMKWELPEPGFWLGFMTTLIKMYLLYPVLKFICRDSKEANEGRWFLMLLTFGGQILVPALGIECYVYMPIDSYALLYFLIGYEGYRWKQQNRLKKKWLIPACAGGYVVSGIITWVASIYLDIGKEGVFTEAFFGYTSWNIVVEAFCVFMLFLCMSEYFDWNISSKTGKLIRWLSGRTLVIYLMHYLVILKIQAKGYDVRLSKILGENFIFFIFYVLLVFGVSLVISSVCEVVKSQTKKGFDLIFSR